jgi:molybdopterin-guanine dinucleotide biosynthesis protein A
MMPVGVVLAGGAARRMGGAKAGARLGGRALIEYPLAALASVSNERVVVAKAGTALPPLPDGVVVWIEPDVPRHPAAGVRHALRSAEGRPVLCVAVDLPWLDGPTLRRLLMADDGRHGCVVAEAGGRLQPLCALWHPAALTALEAAGEGLPMRELVRRAEPLRVAFEDPRPFVNVNSPAELAACPAPALASG